MMLQFQNHITNLANVITQIQSQLAAQQEKSDKKMDSILAKLDDSPRPHHLAHIPVKSLLFPVANLVQTYTPTLLKPILLSLSIYFKSP